MANPLDRTWYNTLIDDDGSGTVGTVWNKPQVDGLLDSVDASLAGLVDRTGTPAANSLAVFTDADTLVGSAVLSSGTLGGSLTIASPVYAAIALSATGQPVDGKLWHVVNQDGVLYFLRMNDAGAYVSTAVMINRNGDVSVGRALSVLGGAVVFPSVQIPSANANAFDDYREVSFTPAFSAAGGASGQTYATQWGRYVKIGKAIIGSARITLSNRGTFSGTALIIGMPVTDSMALYVPSIGYYSGWAMPANFTAWAPLGSSGGAIDLYYMGTGAQAIGTIDSTAFTNSSDVIFSFTAIAAQ